MIQTAESITNLTSFKTRSHSLYDIWGQILFRALRFFLMEKSSFKLKVVKFKMNLRQFEANSFCSKMKITTHRQNTLAYSGRGLLHRENNVAQFDILDSICFTTERFNLEGADVHLAFNFINLLLTPTYVSFW
jgi:hypothetical protein